MIFVLINPRKIGVSNKCNIPGFVVGNIALRGVVVVAVEAVVVVVASAICIKRICN